MGLDPKDYDSVFIFRIDIVGPGDTGEAGDYDYLVLKKLDINLIEKYLQDEYFLSFKTKPLLTEDLSKQEIHLDLKGIETVISAKMDFTSGLLRKH